MAFTMTSMASRKACIVSRPAAAPVAPRVAAPVPRMNRVQYQGDNQDNTGAKTLEGTKDVANKVASKAQEGAERAAEAPGEVGKAVSNAASNLKENVKEAADSAKEDVKTVGQTVGESADKGLNQSPQAGLKDAGAKLSGQDTTSSATPAKVVDRAPVTAAEAIAQSQEEAKQDVGNNARDTSTGGKPKNSEAGTQ